MTRILIRASKSPFDSFVDGPVPFSELASVHKALHAPGTRNIGNLVFAHSTYKAISADDAQIDIDDYQLSLSDYYADKADEINERYDVFVIPLCNSFRRSYKDTLARMAATIRKIKIPCIVTGVGAQTGLGGDLAKLEVIRDEAKEFVSAILDRSESIGVRGELTRDYLISLGFPGSQIDVIGCPSMFYNGENLKIRPRDKLGAVALNLSSAITNKKLLNFAGYFNSNPENVTYIPQVRELMPMFIKGQFPDPQAAPDMDMPIPRIVANKQVAFLCDVVPWIDFMRTQSFAIGTRIHGNVTALLAGTPAHVIAHDSRTLELAKYFEIPHTELSKIRQFDLRKTFESSDYTAMEKNHGERLAIYAKFLERNGLKHILYDQEKLKAHDAKIKDSLKHTRIPAAA